MCLMAGLTVLSFASALVCTFRLNPHVACMRRICWTASSYALNCVRKGSLLRTALRSLVYRVPEVKAIPSARSRSIKSLTSVTNLCRYSRLLFGKHNDGLEKDSLIEGNKEHHISELRVKVASNDQSLGIQTDESYTLEISRPHSYLNVGPTISHFPHSPRLAAPHTTTHPAYCLGPTWPFG